MARWLCAGAVVPRARRAQLAGGAAAAGRRTPSVLLVRAGRQSEKGAKLAQKLGPTSALYSCAPTGMHGPTCIRFSGPT